MNALRVKILSFFILVWLTACGTGRSTLLPLTATGDYPTPPLDAQRTPDPTATSTLTKVPAALTATLEPTTTWTPTITPTVVITTPLTPTTTHTTMPGGLSQLTPGAEITSTTGISPTILITTTTILTKTWTFTDVLVTQSGNSRQLAWNQDGSLFAAATSVGLFLYNAETLEFARSFNVGEPVQAVAFSPVEGLLVSGSLKGDIQWWSPGTGRYGGTFKGGLLGVTSLSFSAQGETMASGNDDGTIRVWNPSQLLDPAITSYEPLHIWNAADRVTSVDINQNVQLAAAGSYQEVSIWDLGTGELLQTLGDFKGWVGDIAISPSGGYLAVADSSNHLRLLETGNWELAYDIPLEGFDSITALDFSPNGLMVALGGKNGKVVLWNLASNTLQDPETRYDHPVTDIAFHPRERNLISSYRDGLLRLWSYQP